MDKYVNFSINNGEGFNIDKTWVPGNKTEKSVMLVMQPNDLF